MPRLLEHINTQGVKPVGNVLQLAEVYIYAKTPLPEHSINTQGGVVVLIMINITAINIKFVFASRQYALVGCSLHIRQDFLSTA